MSDNNDSDNHVTISSGTVIFEGEEIEIEETFKAMRNALNGLARAMAIAAPDDSDPDQCPVCGEEYDVVHENGFRSTWSGDVNVRVCTGTDSNKTYVHVDEDEDSTVDQGQLVEFEPDDTWVVENDVAETCIHGRSDCPHCNHE